MGGLPCPLVFSKRPGLGLAGGLVSITICDLPSEDFLVLPSLVPGSGALVFISSALILEDSECNWTGLCRCAEWRCCRV